MKVQQQAPTQMPWGLPPMAGGPVRPRGRATCTYSDCGTFSSSSSSNPPPPPPHHSLTCTTGKLPFMCQILSRIPRWPLPSWNAARKGLCQVREELLWTTVIRDIHRELVTRHQPWPPVHPCLRPQLSRMAGRSQQESVN